MRLITWNVWWRFGPWEARHAAVEAVLRAEAPDVVCLQEVWAEEGGADLASLLGTALGLDAACALAPFHDGLAFCNAVLSAWPIVAAETVRLPALDGAPSHRHLLWCELDHPAGRRYVASTHLEYPFDASATRVVQTRAVAELVAARRPAPESNFPVVVAGDLNAVPDSDELRLLTGRTAPPVPGLVFTDAWEVAGNGGVGATWDAANLHQAGTAWPRRRLDYVLVSWPRPKPYGNPVGCHLAGVQPVDGVQASDHYAVVADLSEDPPLSP
jgi:endonuclease/exonuclease/phosphatase family metal-dependent hydrolase